MYNNFQQNRFSRSVKTVHTNLFAKICNLQLDFRKITPFGHAYHLTDIQADFEFNRPVRYQNTAKINYFHGRLTDRRTDGRTDGQTSRTTIGSFSKKEKNTKNRPFQTCIIVKRTCISIFSKIGLVDQSKLCTQIYLQKFTNCINLQLAIRISKNHAFRTCTTSSRTFRPILRSIGLLDNELPRKEIISTNDRRTDERTDGQTDGRTDVAHDNNSIFFEKKTTKKGTVCSRSK